MDVKELVNKLEELKVPHRFYSINGHLSPDTYFLNQVYHYWECFYFDERGGTNNYRKFDNENDACTYFYKELKEEMEFYNQVKRTQKKDN